MEWIGEATWAAALLAVTARITGIFLVAPIFSTSALSIRLRVLMSVVFAQALVAWARPVALPASPVALAVALACELAVGATIGYAARLIFAGVQLGAFHIGQQMGFSLAEVYQGGGTAGGGILRRFLYLLTAVIFLAIGGHRDLILALRQTFQAVPIMQVSLSPGLTELVVALLHASFALALKVAAPVLIAMLLATVGLGILQRTLPQCNMLTIGLPARVLLGLLMLAAALAVLSPQVQRAWSATFGLMTAWLGGIG